jgi:hypothetical protein
VVELDVEVLGGTEEVLADVLVLVDALVEVLVEALVVETALVSAGTSVNLQTSHTTQAVAAFA